MNNTVIVVAIGVIIIVFGFLIFGTMNDAPVEVPVNVNSSTNSSSSDQIEAQRRAAESEEQRQETEANKVAFTIDVTKLPEAQQVALKTMGVNETSIEITNGMLACVGADMSEARMAEVKGGATVTMGEGIKLISCYNEN